MPIGESEKCMDSSILISVGVKIIQGQTIDHERRVKGMPRNIGMKRGVGASSREKTFNSPKSPGNAK
jgi:hypothetical protein